MPGRKELYSCECPTPDEVHFKRKIALEAIKAKRKDQPLTDLQSYEERMKKMAKMVSMILYHKILQTHTERPKPSKLALLFSEKNFLPSQKQVRTSCSWGVTTTFPIFQFVVMTDDLLDVEDDVDPSRYSNSAIYNKITDFHILEKVTSKYTQEENRKNLPIFNVNKVSQEIHEKYRHI